MGSIILPELSLDVRPSFVPKTITEFIGELDLIGTVSEKIRRIDDFVGRLEEELRKIDAFKRELPLCMLVTSDAILALKDELAKCRKRNAEPKLEEFIPLKGNCTEEEKVENKKENDNRDKMNWMSSVQLWNNDDSKTSGFDQKQDLVSKFTKEKEDSFSRVFSTINNEKGVPFPGLSLSSPRIDFCGFTSKASGSSGISSSTPESQSNLRNGPQSQSGRKHRRCWSPELHRLFIDALEKLGGSQVATPKQIRDLMRVDGLTNDEVKSHLQKYRLHTRRIPSRAASSSNQSSTDLGGLWIQSDHHNIISSKQISSTTSQSGSPTGPLQSSKNGEDDEYDDEGSESYNWKNQTRKSG